MKGNYDYVAPFYDHLSRVVYGNAIINAHTFLIDSITANSSILIIGGGTGWILPAIAQRYPTGLRITYVDISSAMIKQAKKRDIANNSIFFIKAPIQEADIAERFDTIITPFVLDNFSADTLQLVFNKLDELLKPCGKWLFADFKMSKKQIFWQKTLLQLMYFFFRTVCNIEAKHLPDTDALFANYSYKAISSKTFFHDFICSFVYEKQS